MSCAKYEKLQHVASKLEKVTFLCQKCHIILEIIQNTDGPHVFMYYLGNNCQHGPDFNRICWKLWYPKTPERMGTFWSIFGKFWILTSLGYHKTCVFSTIWTRLYLGAINLEWWPKYGTPIGMFFTHPTGNYSISTCNEVMNN